MFFIERYVCVFIIKLIKSYIKLYGNSNLVWDKINVLCFVCFNSFSVIYFKKYIKIMSIIDCLR